jgi:hypothetical protein
MFNAGSGTAVYSTAPASVPGPRLYRGLNLSGSRIGEDVRGTFCLICLTYLCTERVRYQTDAIP